MKRQELEHAYNEALVTLKEMGVRPMLSAEAAQALNDWQLQTLLQETAMLIVRRVRVQREAE